MIKIKVYIQIFKNQKMKILTIIIIISIFIQKNYCLQILLMKIMNKYLICQECQIKIFLK